LLKVGKNMGHRAANCSGETPVGSATCKATRWSVSRTIFTSYQKLKEFTHKEVEFVMSIPTDGGSKTMYGVEIFVRETKAPSHVV